MALNVTMYGKLDMSSAQKILDNFLKQKPKLNIDVNIDGFDKIQHDLQKFHEAVSKMIAERNKLEESISTGKLTTEQTEALKLIEQREKELAATREQLLKEFASVQEQITKLRLESLERISAKEQENAAKAEDAINRQAAAFQRMYGELQEGVTLPIEGGTDEITSAIRAMEGFSDANVKATGSIQVGEVTLDRYIATLKNAGGGFDTYKISVDNATGAVYQLDQGLKSTDTSLIHTSEVANRVINSFAGALVAAGITKGLNEVKNLLWECAEASVEFEATMAGVRRTVGGTQEQISILGDGLKELATVIPLSTTELGTISTIAGQLGIAQDNILQFTEIMAKLGTVTDATAEQAATLLAQFVNITGLGAEDYERLGSTIAKLGDETATTASRIIDMSHGFAATATVAGFTDQSILAISAALSATGIEAQLGATAMNKLIITLQKAVETGEDLEQYAKTANMSAEEFAQAWGKDAPSAFVQFISGINNVERNGKSAILMLDELGITEVRSVRALQNLAQNSEQLSSVMNTANLAWEENTALNEKAGIMYETTSAKMQLLENATDQLKIAIGDSLNPAINSAVDGISDFTLGAAEFLEQNKWLVQSLTVLLVLVGTATGGIALYAVGIKALTAAKLALAKAARTAAEANAGFMATLVATPIGPVILALAGVAAAITAITIVTGENSKANKEAAQQAEEARQRSIEAGNAAKDQADKLMQLYSSYASLNNITDKTADQEYQYKTVQQDIIELLGSRADALKTLKEGTEEYTEKLKELTDEEIRNQLTDVISGKYAAKEALETIETGSLKITSQAPAGGKWVYEDISDIEALIGKYVELKDVYVLWRKTDEEERLTAPSGADERLEYYSDLIKAQEALIVAAGEDKEAQEELAATNVYKFLSDEINKLTPSINELIEFETSHALLLYQLSNGIPKTTEEYDNMVNSVIGAIGVNESFSNQIKDLITKKFPQFSSAANDVSDSNENLTSSISDLSESIKALNQEIDNAQSALKSIISAQEEYNNYNELSIDTIQTLLSLDKEYLDALIDENGQINLNSESVANLINDKTAYLKALAAEQIATYAVTSLEKLMAEATDDVGTSADDAVSGISSVASEMLSMASTAMTAAVASDSLKAALDRLAGEKGATGIDLEAWETDVVNYANDLKTIIKEAGTGIGGFTGDYTRSSGGSKSSTDTWKEEYESQYKELQHLLNIELITQQEYYDRLSALDAKYYANNAKYISDHQKNLEELFKLKRTLSEDSISDQEHEIFLLSKQKDTEQERIVIYKNMQDQLHQLAEQARAYGIDENSDYIQELQKQWWQFYQYILDIQEEAFQETVDQLNNIQSAYETLYSAVEEYNQQGYYSIETLNNILSMGTDYLLYLTNENGQLEINKESIEKLALAKLDELEISTLRQHLGLLDSLTNEAAAEEYLRTATLDQTDALSVLNAEMANTVALMVASGQISEEVAEKWIGQAQAIRDAFSATREGINKVGVSPSVTASEYEKGVAQAEKEYEDRILSAEEYYKELEKLRLEYYGGESAYSKTLQEENQKKFADALKEEYDEQMKAYDLY